MTPLISVHLHIHANSTTYCIITNCIYLWNRIIVLLLVSNVSHEALHIHICCKAEHYHDLHQVGFSLINELGPLKGLITAWCWDELLQHNIQFNLIHQLKQTKRNFVSLPWKFFYIGYVDMETLPTSYFNIKPKSFCKFLCFFKLVLIKKSVQSGGNRERNGV